MLFLIFHLFFSPLPSFASSEECQTILMEDFGGSVKLHREQESAVPLTSEESLDPGESLTTGEDSWVDLRFCDGSTTRIGENSEYQFESASNDGTDFWQWSMQLVRGSLRAIVEKETDPQKVKVIISTPHASMGVRGTEFVVDSDNAKTELHTLEGDVLIGAKEDAAAFRQEPIKNLAQKFESVKQNSMADVNSSSKKRIKAIAFNREEFFKKREKRAIYRKALIKGKRKDFRERVQRRKALHIQHKERKRAQREVRKKRVHLQERIRHHRRH